MGTTLSKLTEVKYLEPAGNLPFALSDYEVPRSSLGSDERGEKWRWAMNWGSLATLNSSKNGAGRMVR